MVYSHTGKLFSDKKEWVIDTWYNMIDSENNATGEEDNTKAHIYVSSHMKCLKRQIYRDRK